VEKPICFAAKNYAPEEYHVKIKKRFSLND